MDWHYLLMCRVNSYNEEKLDFTTTRLLPRPCTWWLADEDRIFLILLQAIPPACGGRTCNSGFDIVEVVVTSLFVFSKRRRAKHNPNMAVANACVAVFVQGWGMVRCLGARIQPGSCMRQNCYLSPLLQYQYLLVQPCKSERSICLSRDFNK